MVRAAILPRDEAAILSFIQALQDFEAGFEPNRRRDAAFAAEHWAVLRARVAQKHGALLIAEDDGGPVGWACAHDEEGEVFVTAADRPHGALVEIYVAPEARGRGHGRALIAACEDWARGRGHTLLTIGVLARNRGAVQAYQRAGYAPYTLALRRYL